MLCLTFLTDVRTLQLLNCGGQESRRKKKATYDSDTPVTLKQNQGQLTWYELVGPMQDYNNTKFEKNTLEQCP